MNLGMPFVGAIFNVKQKVMDMFADWLADTLKSIFKLFADVLFKSHGLTGFFSTLYNVFISVGSTLMLCIVLYRIVVGMTNIAGGDSKEETVWLIIVDTVKSSSLIFIFPVLLKFCMDKIVYPLGRYMFGETGKLTAMTISNSLNKKMASLFSIDKVTDNSSFTLLILTLFIVIVFVAFIYKFCVFHAEIIFMLLISPLVAISKMTSDNDFTSIYWKEFLSQTSSILVQTACMVGIVEIFSKKSMEWFDFMLLIGLGILIIRGPSFMKSIWYSTGGSKAGTGTMRQVATTAMFKLIK